MYTPSTTVCSVWLGYRNEHLTEFLNSCSRKARWKQKSDEHQISLHFPWNRCQYLSKCKLGHNSKETWPPGHWKSQVQGAGRARKGDKFPLWSAWKGLFWGLAHCTRQLKHINRSTSSPSFPAFLFSSPVVVDCSSKISEILEVMSVCLWSHNICEFLYSRFVTLDCALRAGLGCRAVTD